jgi:hypothetical protein
MRPAALLVLAVLVLAACQPSASASPSPSVAASEPRPSEPEPSAIVLCDPGVVCNGPLPAGDYVSETTGARVEFTLDDHDWFGQEDTPGDGFSLFLADVDEGAISVVSYSGEIFTDSCNPEAGTEQVEDSPAAFMDMLTTGTGITASAPVEVEVGGQPGLQTDLTVALDADCMTTGNGRTYLWTLPVHGDFHFNDGEQARVIAVDAEGTTVILVVEALPEIEDYDHLLEHFEEVVQTMSILPL